MVLAEFVRVLFLGGPVGEELGWRGFALPRLQQHRNALDASILLGLIWGLWHLPLYFVLGTGQSELLRAGTSPVFAIGGFIGWTIGLSVLFTWLFNQTGGSLIVVILFHASVNLAAFLPTAVGSGGPASLLNVVITWLVAIGVVVRCRSGPAGIPAPGRGGDRTMSTADTRRPAHDHWPAHNHRPDRGAGRPVPGPVRPRAADPAIATSIRPPRCCSARACCGCWPAR